MFEFKNDEVAKIYEEQMKNFQREIFYDNDYMEHFDHLQKCEEELKNTLTPEQKLPFDRFMSAVQLLGDYNRCKCFGKGMKYMYDLGICLKNKY